MNKQNILGIVGQLEAIAAKITPGSMAEVELKTAIGQLRGVATAPDEPTAQAVPTFGTEVVEEIKEAWEEAFSNAILGPIKDIHARLNTIGVGVAQLLTPTKAETINDPAPAAGPAAQAA